MIQRYKTSTKLRPHDCEIVSISVPDDEGDYVLYDDHMQVLESIGAGGVSGRITQKTIDDVRREFRAWAEENCHDLTLYSDARNQDEYLGQDTGSAWEAWLHLHALSNTPIPADKTIDEHRSEFEDATFNTSYGPLQEIYEAFKPHSIRRDERGRYKDEWMEHRWQSWCLAKGIKKDAQ